MIDTQIVWVSSPNHPFGVQVYGVVVREECGSVSLVYPFAERLPGLWHQMLSNAALGEMYGLRACQTRLVAERVIDALGERR